MFVDLLVTLLRAKKKRSKVYFIVLPEIREFAGNRMLDINSNMPS